MKLLLDECVPKRLRNDFPGHEVSTIEEVGLKGLKNGELFTGRCRTVRRIDYRGPEDADPAEPRTV
jgi:hypothetical protein